MTTPEDRIAQLGLALPAPANVPEGLRMPFAFVNIRGDRALIAGHPRLAPDGNFDGPFGRLGESVTTDEGYRMARDIALGVFANLKAELGELDRVAGWVRVLGMVTSTPAYTEQHLVMNGFSDLVLEVFGPQVGRHARSSLGVAAMPLGFAIEVEGEVLIRP